MKLFGLTVVLSLLVPLLPGLVWSRPIFLNSQYPELPTSNLNTANCYFQTADGRILNLDRLCKTPDNNGRISESRVNNSEVSSGESRTPEAPINNSGSNAVTKPCYGLDENGRPCGAAGNQRGENQTSSP